MSELFLHHRGALQFSLCASRLLYRALLAALPDGAPVPPVLHELLVRRRDALSPQTSCVDLRQPPPPLDREAVRIALTERVGVVAAATALAAPDPALLPGPWQRGPRLRFLARLLELQRLLLATLDGPRGRPTPVSAFMPRDDLRRLEIERLQLRLDSIALLERHGVEADADEGRRRIELIDRLLVLLGSESPADAARIHAVQLLKVHAYGRLAGTPPPGG